MKVFPVVEVAIMPSDPHLETIRYYDQFGAEFDKIPFGSDLQRLIDRYLPDETGLSALDIGSGPGALAVWLQGKGCQVTCLDPSSTMVALCRKKGLDAYQGELADLPETRTFDVGLAISSLIHLSKSDLPAAIQKIHRLLRPSSLLFLTMLLGEGEGFEDPLGKGINRHFTYCDRGELEAVLQAGGFSILHVEERPVKKMNVTFGLYVLQKGSDPTTQ